MAPFRPITLDAGNPGAMTGDGNHTYLIPDDDGGAILVDAGVAHPQHLGALGAALDACQARLSCVLVTHAHGDHISGVEAIAALHPEARFLKYPRPGEDDRFRVRWEAVHDGDHVGGRAYDLVAIHTPGHSPDHLSLWHARSRTAFTGDLVVAGGSVMIDAGRGGDVGQYLASLERLIALEPDRLLPAHGSVVDDPMPLLRGYIAHRLEREAQIVVALSAGFDVVPAIVGTIYDGLTPSLMTAAHETVRAHLEKLRHEGRAVEHDGRWRLLPL